LKTLESRVICTSQHVCIQHILRSRNFSLLNSFLHCNRSLFLFGLLGWGLEPTLLILDLCPRTPYLNPTNSAGTHSLALFNLLNRRTKNCGRFLEVSPRKGLKCYPCEIRRTKAPGTSSDCGMPSLAPPQVTLRTKYLLKPQALRNTLLHTILTVLQAFRKNTMITSSKLKHTSNLPT
jgi:hypothetical protein